MKQIRIGLALLVAAGGVGMFSLQAQADEAGYRQLVELSDGEVASELVVNGKQIVVVIENHFEAEAIVSYDAKGQELWRTPLNGAQYAIGDKAFVLVSRNNVTVHSLSDGNETDSFSLGDEFRTRSTGASVSIESGHVLVTGNLGARLLVYQLDGTLAAEVSGANLRQATISQGQLMYFDGTTLYGRLLSGGKEWRSEDVLEPYALGNEIIYYIKSSTEEIEAPVLVARSLKTQQVLYEKTLPLAEVLRLVGADEDGAIMEFATSGEWVFLNSRGGERVREPIRSAAFQALENRYRPVVRGYKIGYEQQGDQRLLLLRETGTSAYGNPYQLGTLQVMKQSGSFEKVLEHSVEAALLSPSGGVALLGGESLKLYDPNGNQVAVASVPTGSDGLAAADGSFYVYGGSGIAAFAGEPEPQASVVRQISGADGYETAALVSSEVWDSAETVVIATGEYFADALSGVPLAYQLGGPLLFTERNRLNAATKAEIERLGAKKAIIIGGEPAVSDEQLEELSSIGVESQRIGGVNRYETAALVAQQIDSDGAVVADGRTFKDVSLASVYAAQNRFPILLAKGSRLPSETMEAMAGRSDIVLAGDNRSFKSRMAQEPARTEAVLAAASSFTDSLAAANAAAKRKASLYLIGAEGVTEELKEQLKHYESIIVVDSAGVIDAEDIRTLEALVD